MTKVLILGGSGMLGQMLFAVLARDSALEVTATYRDPAWPRSLGDAFPRACFWPADLLQLSEEDGKALIGKFDYVLNAAGLIKQKIDESSSASIRDAILINALFPHVLARWAAQSETEILQIETDCVFSGRSGSYLESSEHDALDVYGKTKSLGEVRAPHVCHLRCSIVGPERGTCFSLLDWFRGQRRRAWIRGFSNHAWNGITTYHFARICQGIIREGAKVRRLQHVVPSGQVSKLELLRIFAEVFGRADLQIEGFETVPGVNRTLSTFDPESNAKLWALAGYAHPPTIPEMIHELAAAETELGLARKEAAA